MSEFSEKPNLPAYTEKSSSTNMLGSITPEVIGQIQLFGGPLLTLVALAVLVWQVRLLIEALR